jgi:hypothetical protein
MGSHILQGQSDVQEQVLQYQFVRILVFELISTEIK